ncbi:MAG: HU family DNA-binding protein, partial [Magnetococcales bacterium]|nr:HU family DNA-binding protein [Magnetococcales bacterium]
SIQTLLSWTGIFLRTPSKIPAAKVVKFKVGKALKDAVNTKTGKKGKKK